MTWTIRTDREFDRALKKLDRQVARRVLKSLIALQELEDPTKRCKALSGPYAGLWRLRVGDYRVIVDIRRGELNMAKTQPEPARDPAEDHLLTPDNCVVALIDFQPEQYSTVTSASRERIELNVIALARLARLYDTPVVLSTVGVDLGVNEGTSPAIRDELPGVKEIDRTGVNSWEDADFRAAIRESGRRKVVLAGLWTEVCLTFPTLDMLAEGYEVYPVADAVGGVSAVSHNRSFDRMIAAGAQPITTISFGSELMRNWARDDADNLRQVMQWYFPRKHELDKAEGVLDPRG